MAQTPPLPPGFTLEQPERPDPWETLRAEGFVANNGFRTDTDVSRIRAQGYTPAAHGDHNRADAVDLDHPSLSPAQQAARLRAMFGGWRGAVILDEGHHRHLALPGWGAAPGTPGSPNFGLPDLPEGFELIQRGSLSDPDNFRAAPAAGPMAGGAAPLGFAGTQTNTFNPLDPRNAPTWHRLQDLVPAAIAPQALIPDRIGGAPPQGAGAVEVMPNDPAGTHVATTQHPERLRQALATLEQLFDAGAPRRELVATAERFGVPQASPGWAQQLDAALRWRGQGGDVRSVGTFIPGEVQRVERDMPTDPQAATLEAIRRSGLASEARAYEPSPIIDPVSQGFGAAASALTGGDRFTASGQSQNMRDFLGSWWNPALPLDWAAQRGRQATEATIGGRHLESLGHTALGAVDAAIAIPFFGPGRTSQLGARAMGEIEGLAARNGITDLGPQSNEALSALVRQNWGSLSPETRQAIGALTPTSAGPRPLSGGLIDDLRGTVRQPGAIQRFRERLRGSTAPEAEPQAGAIGAEGSPAAFVRDLLQNSPEAGGEWRARADELRNAARSAAPEEAARLSPAAPSAVARLRDIIDVTGARTPLPGPAMEAPLGRVRPLGGQPDPADIAAVARSIRPESVTPIPGNRVESLAEFDRANPGSIRPVAAPRPETFLEMRTYQHPISGKPVRFRGPLDLEAFARSLGGLRDEGGELRHIGIRSNHGRPEMSGESRLGPIVTPNGMSLDDFGEAAAEAGYFGERPTTADIVDALRAGRLGREQAAWRLDDIEEVQTFGQAQSQRFTADEAEQAGRPLGEQVGEPVGFGDLDAMEPPATAYEDLPQLGGTVGNIALGRIETVGDIRRLLQNVETSFGGFGAARRGQVSHAETRALADEIGMTADDLLRRRRGQALNAEQALRARQLLAKSSDEVLRLAERARGPAASDETRAAFAAAMIRHAAIHEQVTGAVAEAGRALSALRVAASSRDVTGRVHDAIISGAGGHQRLEDVAEGILELQRQGVGPGGVNRFAADAMKPRFRDKLVELWYNWLLSGPQTHAVNIISNMMTAGLQIPEQTLAAGIGYARRAVRGARGKPDDFDRVMFSELGPRTVGLMQGAWEGLEAAGRTFLTGEVSDAVTKVEASRQHAIGGWAGSVLRTPTRALASEDEFFKAVGRRMELSALAVREARKEGLRGDALRQRIADLTASPTPEMLERSLDYARYVTFQRPLKGLPSDVSRFTQRQPWMKLFLPFVRTPTNLFKFAIERSPAAPVLGEVRANFAAGGERQAVAAARMAMGTGLGMLIASWAAQGKITGALPEDRTARELFLANGGQQYSIRVGDSWYSYQRLDPIAMTLGTAANLSNAVRSLRGGHVDRAGAEFIASIIGNLSDKTWLSGISDLVSVLDPSGGPAMHEGRLNSFLSRLGGSIAVPTGVAQIARTLDPLQRDTRGDGVMESVWNRIQSRLPGVSQSLPARRDILGREVSNEGGLGPDIASPVWTREAQDDPIIGEIQRLRVPLGRPQRTVTIDGERVELSREEFGRYQEMAGQYLLNDLGAMFSDPEYRQADDDRRRRWVRDAVKDARADARADLLGGSGALPPLPPGFELVR